MVSKECAIIMIPFVPENAMVAIADGNIEFDLSFVTKVSVRSVRWKVPRGWDPDRSPLFHYNCTGFDEECGDHLV